MHLLWVANFPAETGYAWATIEAVFRSVGERLVREGHRVTVAYPGELPAGGPPGMRGAPFAVASFEKENGFLELLRLIRSVRADALYLTDRSSWSLRYPAYRLAGVRRIILHDRTSGIRRQRLVGLKRLIHAVPGLSVDRALGISRFVRQRLIEVNGLPAAKVTCVYNGIDLGRFDAPDRTALLRALDLPPTCRVVFCSARAQRYKGIQVVIEAAALLRRAGIRDVVFAYAGDGPYLDTLREMARDEPSVRFLERRGDVPQLLAGATAAVVPSLWAEAYGLSVVEAMAAGVPLVATRVGGIPELVEEGVTGLLVPPGDAGGLAESIRRILDHPAESAAMASRAGAWVREHASLERSAAALHAVLAEALGEREVGRSPMLNAEC